MRQAIGQMLNLEGQGTNYEQAIDIWLEGYGTEETEASLHRDQREEYARRMSFPISDDYCSCAFFG